MGIEFMKHHHFIENGFVLIPDSEIFTGEYELNRKKYPTFEWFLSQLIE